MIGLHDSRKPANEPGFASFLVVAGGLVLGLFFGELLVNVAYGLRLSAWVTPWWLSLSMILFALLAVIRCEGGLLRLALVLFACDFLVAIAEATVLGSGYPRVRGGLTMAAALVSAMAGWRAARPWARVLACVLLLAGVPARYWVVREVLGLGSVVRVSSPDGPSNLRLHPTAATKRAS